MGGYVVTIWMPPKVRNKREVVEKEILEMHEKRWR